jgi:hypothetical protein
MPATMITKRGTSILPSYALRPLGGYGVSIPHPTLFLEMQCGAAAFCRDSKGKGPPGCPDGPFENTLSRDDYIAFVVFVSVVVVFSTTVPFSGAAVSMLVTIVSVVVTFSVGTTSVVFVTLVVLSLLVHAEARRAAPAIIEPATIFERTARM